MEAVLRDFPSSFETKRLTIRCPMPGDGVALNTAVLASLDELRPWMPWAVKAPTVEENETFARRAHAKFLTREDMALFLLLKETNTIIGGSGLHRMDWSVPRFEIGYWLRTGYTGQGYMTEAVTAIADFAFNTLGAKRVEIHCDANNVKSAAIPRRLGFTLEGTLRNTDRHHLTNELRDTMIFAKIAPWSP
jgi:RimJ/RimL family protein N-acetyltransferase